MVISKRYFVTGFTPDGEMAYVRVAAGSGNLILDNTNLDFGFRIVSIAKGDADLENWVIPADIEEIIIEFVKREWGLTQIYISYIDLIKNN